MGILPVVLKRQAGSLSHHSLLAMTVLFPAVTEESRWHEQRCPVSGYTRRLCKFLKDALHFGLHHRCFRRLGVIIPDEMKYSVDE